MSKWFIKPSYSYIESNLDRAAYSKLRVQMLLVTGYLGLLQPLADGLDFFVKETVLPTNANIVLFVLAPLITV